MSILTKCVIGTTGLIWLLAVGLLVDYFYKRTRYLKSYRELIDSIEKMIKSSEEKA